uniref:Uncharacterized protein n=1 Tax=Elaeophora elaphi TaxID=1147741 RepID=A0A0R3RH90_9BILA
MAAHRKFTFENPEDSYWNSSDFIDIPVDSSSTNAAAARAALDHLFESKFLFDNSDSWSNAGNESQSTVESPTNQNLRNESADVFKTIEDLEPSSTFVQFRSLFMEDQPLDSRSKTKTSYEFWNSLIPSITDSSDEVFLFWTCFFFLI